MNRLKKPKVSLPVPVEQEEMENLFEWAGLSAGKHPELNDMFHIPNGGWRSKREAGLFKQAGVKPGVPDICLPVPRGGYNGLYIEMKRTRGSHTSDDQKAWVEKLNHYGYYAVICKGWISASEVILSYLSLTES